jgi:formate dehydrogenase
MSPAPRCRHRRAIPRGTREILEAYFAGKPIRTKYLIVDKGKLAGTGAKSYTAGDMTKGSDKAA